MADTYTISSYQQMGVDKTLLSIFNPVASGKIVKVYRFWHLNHANVSDFASAYYKILFSKISSATGGSDVSGLAVRHLLSSPTISGITILTSSTIVATATIRQICYASGTSATAIAAVYTINQIQGIAPLARVWECGYYNTILQPIVLREGEGVAVHKLGAGIFGFSETVIEFTIE